jgi:hypothetical protein
MTTEELFEQISKDELIKAINGTSPFFTMQDRTAMAKFILSVADEKSFVGDCQQRIGLLERKLSAARDSISKYREENIYLRSLSDTEVNRLKHKSNYLQFSNDTLKNRNEDQFKLVEAYRKDNENLKAELAKRNDWDQKVFPNLKDYTDPDGYVYKPCDGESHYIFSKRTIELRNENEELIKKLNPLKDFQTKDGTVYHPNDGEAAYNLKKRIDNLRDEVKGLKRENKDLINKVKELTQTNKNLSNIVWNKNKEDFWNQNPFMAKWDHAKDKDYTGFLTEFHPSGPNCRCSVTPTKDAYEKFITTLKKCLPEHVKKAIEGAGEIILTEVTVHGGGVSFKGEI